MCCGDRWLGPLPMTSEAQGKSLETLCEAGSSMPACMLGARHRHSVCRRRLPFGLSAREAEVFLARVSCRLLFLLLRARTCSLLSKIGSMYACSEHLQPLFHGPQSSIIVQRSSLPNRGLLRLPTSLLSRRQQILSYCLSFPSTHSSLGVTAKLQLRDERCLCRF